MTFLVETFRSTFKSLFNFLFEFDSLVFLMLASAIEHASWNELRSVNDVLASCVIAVGGPKEVMVFLKLLCILG